MDVMGRGWNGEMDGEGEKLREFGFGGDTVDGQRE
jgi:hypothetical protein